MNLRNLLVGFRPRSASLTIALGAVAGLAVWLSSCPAAEHAAKEDLPGYDDTPFLPHSPWRVHDRRRPEPPLVEPGSQPGAPPSDAIVLFDGKDLAQWNGGNPAGIEEGTINILKAGEAPHQTVVRRLPAPRRMDVARQGRRRPHDLGQ